MTDADVDGSHIATLLITFFYKYMRKLIENEKLFLAMPPLYRISSKNLTKYAYDEKQKDQILKKLNANQNVNITRYKGLGEMPADQLKVTTMNEEKRNLLKITLHEGKNNLKKTEKIFESLMGKKAENRFKFIQQNANFKIKLDI